jgi:membrane protease YdiL (CAAX protease family)
VIEFSVLIIALFIPILVLGVVHISGRDTLSWSVRLSLWAITFVVLALLVSVEGKESTLRIVGLSNPTVRSLEWGFAGAVGLIAVTGVTTLIQRALKLPIGDRDTFERIAALPLPRRVFLVLTASVIEEVLYRGVGIGVGTSIFGWIVPAAIISLAAFVSAHFRWRSAHLVQVMAAGAVLVELYIVTAGDLWSCIIAHLIVDGVGFILMPAILHSRRQMTV